MIFRGLINKATFPPLFTYSSELNYAIGVLNMHNLHRDSISLFSAPTPIVNFNNFYLGLLLSVSKIHSYNLHLDQYVTYKV